MTRYDEHDTCSICGDILNDVGGCDNCHGDPYFEDEWYEDEDDLEDVDYGNIVYFGLDDTDEYPNIDQIPF